MTGQATELMAPVFDVQGFSLNDGPGIRTVVFFKGCPLSCKWCHNPESHTGRRELMFHKRLCVGCMECMKVCKHGVHETVLENGVYVHHVHPERCAGCGECLKVCCYDALSLVGDEYTIDMLYRRIEHDLRYYDISTRDGKKGGVTFSGGEPLLYMDFIESFLGKIPGVHTAIETSGFASESVIKKAAKCIDLFLYDYKVTDPIRHKQLCGVDNSTIFKNLEYLYEMNKDIIIRLPLIPGINDTPDHLDGIASLLKTHPRIERAEIMPYHTFGIGKSEELGKEPDKDMPSSGATEEDVSRWLDELHKRGVMNVFRS